MAHAEFEEREFETPLYHQLRVANNHVWSPGQVLVHHGASADQRLARVFGVESGEKLQVSRDHVVRYMRTLDAMASAIASVTPPNVYFFL